MPYYVGLLSAAEIHAVARQSPQEFQVVASKQLRPIVVGRNRSHFFLRKHLDDSAVQLLKNASGQMRVSTSEATVLELVRFHDRVGGLNHVATALAELSEKTNPAKLVVAAERAAGVAPVQRLGFLLDLVGRETVAEKLSKWEDSRE